MRVFESFHSFKLPCLHVHVRTTALALEKRERESGDKKALKSKHKVGGPLKANRQTDRHKWWSRELTLKCKLKCYVKPLKDPLGVSPSKGNQEFFSLPRVVP